MALNLHTEPVQIMSDRKGAVSTPWYHLGGMAMDVQFHGPGNVHGLQVSADKQDADVARDIAGALITGLGPVYRVVRDRPEWVRTQIATDIFGPRLYALEYMVRKEDD